MFSGGEKSRAVLVVRDAPTDATAGRSVIWGSGPTEYGECEGSTATCATSVVKLRDSK